MGLRSRSVEETDSFLALIALPSRLHVACCHQGGTQGVEFTSLHLAISSGPLGCEEVCRFLLLAFVRVACCEAF
jgi:hypothetical protein